MLTTYNIVLTLHAAAGLVGLIAFWAPAVARKGSATHVHLGRLFFRTTCAIAITGIAMAALLLIDPLAVKAPGAVFSPDRAAEIAWRTRLFVPFLLYLVLITFTPVYHGTRVLATRRAPATLRTPFHTAVNVAAIAASAAMLILGILTGYPVFAALSPIGVLIGWGALRFARTPYPTPMAWWYEHMGSMLGGGIAFHTAFLALGAGRLLGIEITGTAAIIPWLLPTLIGIPVSAVWVRYYRRRFREDGARGVPATDPRVVETH
jgi:hypothetical protein